MIQDFNVVRVNYLGGIASPGELRNLLEILRICEVSDLRFGLRQQLIFKVSVLHEKTFNQRMEKAGIDHYIDGNPHPNVVSSYVAEEVFQSGNWLTEGIYKDVFDGFDFNPKLKINISDNDQSFTPFFSGHINFISSAKPNFWHLYYRKPKSNDLIEYDELLYSTELAAIAKKIEVNHFQNKTPFEGLPKVISSEIDRKLELPQFTLPYYEGFNRYGRKSWLGIYRRNEVFKINFLIDLCTLCIETKIGEVCLTPWKSIIIKNIDNKDRPKWSSLLAKHDINVRHAANELNWQIEDDSPSALQLKARLVRYFNQKDLRSFGICLGIKTRPGTEVFASILVTRKKYLGLSFYDITYTRDYDPNGREVAYYAKNVLGFNLPEKLRRSVLEFNEHIAFYQEPEPGQSSVQSKDVELVEVYECKNCKTVYHDAFGDAVNGILPGTPFSEVDDDYTCPVCFSSKNEYQKKTLASSLFVENT
ncbi:rubredoxin [Jiulongibacter sp. NS-SX5]|uniref:rubredoxin n=1 Tax=Jiulongibacter sp. NS-SX5 TaxID=3463854 RepID=UPI00405A3642